jgi:hypothetical protein
MHALAISLAFTDTPHKYAHTHTHTHTQTYAQMRETSVERGWELIKKEKRTGGEKKESKKWKVPLHHTPLDQNGSVVQAPHCINGHEKRFGNLF